MIELKRITISASAVRSIKGFIFRDKPKEVEIIKRPRFKDKIKEAIGRYKAALFGRR